jgi:hypothetical protein
LAPADDSLNQREQPVKAEDTFDMAGTLNDREDEPPKDEQEYYTREEQIPELKLLKDVKEIIRPLEQPIKVSDGGHNETEPTDLALIENAEFAKS